MNKTLTKPEIKALDAIASDKLGTKCACCERTYTIWYVGSIEIARVYCKCESAPIGANRFGVLTHDEQIAR